VDTSGEIPAGRAKLDVILAQLKDRPRGAFKRHWA